MRDIVNVTVTIDRMTYETISGYPLLTARHFRQAKCGRHVHTVCVDGVCVSHVDRWNPDCHGELGPHMRDDFRPAFKTPILVGAPALLAVLVLSQL